MSPAAIRTLVCDDHDVFRGQLIAMLTRCGYEVVAECASGAEAVSRALETLPEIAILDLTMPGMNGIEATREIRLVSPETHCILLSVLADARRAAEALQSGAEAYVVKSRGLDDLVKAIRSVQEGQHFVSPGADGPEVRAAGWA